MNPDDTPSTDAVFASLCDKARAVSGQASEVRVMCAGSVTVYSLIGLHQVLRDARTYGLSVQNTPGLVEYAQSALGDPNYNILVSFGGMLTVGARVTDWIVANIESVGADGFVGWRLIDGNFQGAAIEAEQLAPFGPLLDALLAPIGPLANWQG